MSRATDVTPKYATLYAAREGEQFAIRAMVPEDKDALLDFFRRIAAEEIQFLRGNPASPEVIQRWAETLDYRRVLPLVALVGDTIVAEASLHRDISPARVAEVRIVVDEAHRNKGLGRFMVKALVDIARDEDAQLEKIVFEVVAGAEEAARHTASALGFEQSDDLSAYVHYFGGTPHDLIQMELPVGTMKSDAEDDPAQAMI